ncbi:MAG: hypothetical protein ACI825_001983 [Planctomycetota bacterium]|jgi:hypothetical protein
MGDENEDNVWEKAANYYLIAFVICLIIFLLIYIFRN